LASATIEEVNSVWAGLGYYSRARNLHNSAIIIVKLFDGVFPSSHENLLTLPGVGYNQQFILYDEHKSIILF